MAIHIGQLIDNRLQVLGITKAEFARRINRARQNVNDIINRPSVDTELLLLISRALEYNFFQHYTIELSGDDKVHDNPGDFVRLGTDLRSCLQRLDDMENDLLRTRNEVISAKEINDLFREKVDRLSSENTELRKQLDSLDDVGSN